MEVEQGDPQTFAGALSDAEFSAIKELIYDLVGLTLNDKKKALVASRLARRVRALRFRTYQEYFEFVRSGQADEVQQFVDALTTNETYFFREPEHFKFLSERILQTRSSTQPFDIWCGAASFGHEVYSLSLVCRDRLNDAPYSILGTDINQTVLNAAREAFYPIEHSQRIPRYYLEKFCLKGKGTRAGTFTFTQEVREPTTFALYNLLSPIPFSKTFDCIFLRNVMIYFDTATRKSVVARVLETLKPGGYLFTGHAESLHSMGLDIRLVEPAVYYKEK